DAAMRATRDVLALAAVRRRHHHFGFAVLQFDGCGFDQRVEHEGAAGFALAPAAMAAVHEQRRAGEAVADVTTVAAAFENVDRCRHGACLPPPSAPPPPAGKENQSAGNSAFRSYSSNFSLSRVPPPSSTACASSALRAFRSSMRSSTVSAQISRYTNTGLSWPMRCARSAAWVSAAGFHHGS